MGGRAVRLTASRRPRIHLVQRIDFVAAPGAEIVTAVGEIVAIRRPADAKVRQLARCFLVPKRVDVVQVDRAQLECRAHALLPCEGRKQYGSRSGSKSVAAR